VALDPAVPEDWWGRYGAHAKNDYCLSFISKLSMDFMGFWMKTSGVREFPRGRENFLPKVVSVDVSWHYYPTI
jgi:hypothetical protein